ncbi:sialidase-2-like [Glandiceps talaboti]
MKMLFFRHKKFIVFLSFVVVIAVVKHFYFPSQNRTDNQRVRSRLIAKSQMNQHIASYKHQFVPNRSNRDKTVDYKLPINWNEDRVFMSETMDIFVSNEEFNVVRIPAMIFHDQRFLIFCEARDRAEDFGYMRLVSKRGTLLSNNTVVWEKTQFVVYKEGMRFMNPSPVYDKTKNNVILVFLGIESTLSEKQMLRDGQHQIRVYVMKSSDYGDSWSQPKDITASTIDTIQVPVAAAYAPGPGHGIQLKSGRLLIAGNHYQKDWSGLIGPKGLYNCSDYSNVIYSDDGGDTWSMGGILPRSRDYLGRKIFANEAQVAELDNGVVVMAMRTLDHHQSRAQAFSYDGGLTFQRGEVIPNLIEPGYKVANGILVPRVSPGCQGSIISFPSPNGSPGNHTWALFSNPASETTRKFMSLRLSYDGCRTWSNPHTIYPWYSGYSDLTYLGEGFLGHTFAIIHEGGYSSEFEKIMMEIFTLDALVKGLAQKKIVFQGNA